jgi:hypothetical protein
MGVAILLLASMMAFEDPPKDVVEFFASVAATLADADRATDDPQPTARHAQQFLEHFDKSMPGYAEFSNRIEALVGGGEVATTIEFVNTEGDDKKRTLDLDWLLECAGRSAKRAMIKCTIEKRGKKWKITSIAPVEFFSR